ncbi:MAG: RsmB/NOP family class I SAM-dependent RNA methyltransferase [Planctomycetota bacterium]
MPPPATPFPATLLAEATVATVLELCAKHAAVGGLARSLLGEEMPRLGLTPTERRVVANGFYRLFRLRRRIELGLASGGRRLPDDQRDRAAYFVALVLDGIVDARTAAQHCGLRHDAFDWSALERLDDAIAAEADPVRRFGLTHSVPDWLAARFIREFGDGAATVVEGLNGEPPLTVRTNTLKTTRAALREAFVALGCIATETTHAPDGLFVDGDISLFGVQPYRDGWFEQQDEASQICASVVAPPPRGNVLDACAGSGGKTLALAAHMQNRGQILATDVSRFKLLELVQRRRRAGVDNVRSKVARADAWPTDVETFAKQADRILVDAPCDGVGSWRRRPDARWRLRQEHLGTVQRKQAMLLRRAVAALQPGARVIYATCTIFGEQNEDQVRGVLATDRDLELVRVAEVMGTAAAAPITDPSGSFLRLWPHQHGADGFFAAVLRRRRIVAP